MKFRVSNDLKILPEDLSYFRVREFQFDENSNPIAEFIPTKYFIWEDDKYDHLKTRDDWKFHGIYDAKKLKAEHFIPLSFEIFKMKFMSFVTEEIEDDPDVPNIAKQLDKLNDMEAEFYLIDNLPKEFRHKSIVFDFFISGFKLDMKHKTLTTIEFGLD
jgi:hypothetical protein